MKKTMKILALVMVAAMLCCVLASCGNTLKGTYAAEVATIRTAYNFDGDTVTIDAGALGVSTQVAEGTYEIKDDQIIFTFGDDNKYTGTFSFEKGDDYIKINGITYTLED
ncbi:MAG: hypothetical protein IJW40_03655 [Clostridia bacterium]|nr:hypothetical protein [Clostridia bacterium]